MPETSLKLDHFDDGKGKYQSHEVYLKDEEFADYDCNLFTLDPFNIVGYGETKEEAEQNFKKKFGRMLQELDQFYKSITQEAL